MSNDSFWRDALHYCCLHAGIGPADFWLLSFPELNALLPAEKQGQATAPNRAAVDALIARYPDLDTAICGDAR